jgi:FMN phosphatase YigB (HAD superfamily)
MIKEPKPALEGFYKMIGLTREPAENILYIGDSLEKDIRPAKQVGLKTGLIWSQSNEADYSFKKFDDVLSLFP